MAAESTKPLASLWTCLCFHKELCISIALKLLCDVAGEIANVVAYININHLSLNILDLFDT
jgi:hypothetical protein